MHSYYWNSSSQLCWCSGEHNKRIYRLGSVCLWPKFCFLSLWYLVFEWLVGVWELLCAASKQNSNMCLVFPCYGWSLWTVNGRRLPTGWHAIRYTVLDHINGWQCVALSSIVLCFIWHCPYIKRSFFCTSCAVYMSFSTITSSISSVCAVLLRINSRVLASKYLVFNPRSVCLCVYQLRIPSCCNYSWR